MNVRTLIQDIKRELANADWKDEYAPPEGRPGQGGPDIFTEMQGFRADGHSLIVGRIERDLQGKSDVAPEQVGNLLTKIAYEQQPNSAGPFIRHFSLELRDRLYPDYLKARASKAFSNAAEIHEPEKLLAEVGEALNVVNEDHAQVLSDVQKTLNGKTGITINELINAFDKAGSDYYGGGDDYMAEIADDWKDAARAVERSAQPDVDAKIAEIRKEERAWGRPLSPG